MELAVGARLGSTACATEVIVVRAPAGEVDIRCGGHPLTTLGAPARSAAPIVAGLDTGTMLGKRYCDEASGLEVLCTRSGNGSLSLGDGPLTQKDAKPLPSSD